MPNTTVLESGVNDSQEPTITSNGEDQDARDRIVRAALVQFANHGFRGASIRGIASAADVSPGLIQHHFGTKDGLRKACDDHVMAYLSDTQQQMVQRGAPPPPGEMAGRLDELQPIIDYLIASLQHGSDRALDWFKQITDYTHESLTSGRIGPPLDPSEDTRAIAATQAAMALGVTAFYRHIQQVLDEDDEANMILRVGRARLFLTSDRIVDQETRNRLASALDDYEQSRTTGKPPPSREYRSDDA